MASAEIVSPSAGIMVGTRLIAAVSIGLVMAGSGAAATEPPVAVEYRSAFADYRHFDAQAPTAEWRAANDAIRNGAEAAAHGHGMHDMPATKIADPAFGDSSADQAATRSSPDQAAPHEGHEPTVTTPDDHPERRE